MGHLYVLSGASGSGKTTLLNDICHEIAQAELGTAIAPKYASKERLARDGSTTADDVIIVDRVSLDEYDICYFLNKATYGIRTDEIREQLRSGKNAFIILSDFRIVARLKRQFADEMTTVYVASAIDPESLRRKQEERLGFRPDEHQKQILKRHFARTDAAAVLGWWDRVSECLAALSADWRAYATDAESTEIRAQRIRAFHIRYIDHIELFDHVVLNYSEGRPDEMVTQAANLIRAGTTLRRESRPSPPLFVVAAASGSGKRTLIEMLHLIGRDRITIATKMGKREARPGDGRDGMTAIGRDGEFPPEFSWAWRFHDHLPGHEGTEYAINPIELQENIDEGRAQILISNMGQFAEFRRRFRDNVVFLYLHKITTELEMRQYQEERCADPAEAQARIQESEFVHQNYIGQIAEFDHVLLNTSYPEDLYDQMLQLIEHYVDDPAP